MELFKKTIPLDTFVLVDEIQDISIVDFLLTDIKNNKEYLPYSTNVIGKHTKWNFLNENKNFHNFILSIQKQTSKICEHDFILESAWANIYAGEDYVLPHKHEGSTAFSGILYLTDKPGPGTYFPQYDLTVEEKKGRFVLFHGSVEHEVKKFIYMKERITVAFNFKTGYVG
tara:strand:+ start:1068 stop:1580 length:513 start_codon:yes stop_codon:yes gene_type:complete